MIKLFKKLILNFKYVLFASWIFKTVILIIIFEPIHAQELPKNCWSEAASTVDIDPWLLYAVAEVESNLDESAVGHNRNGSIDVGLMQINSFWFPSLARVGVSVEDLINQPCTNVLIGAVILRDSIDRYGYGWKAIGAYNAGTGEGDAVHRRRVAYAQRVFSVYRAHLDRLYPDTD